MAHFAQFIRALVVAARHFRKKSDAVFNFETRGEAVIKAEFCCDRPDPDFRAGRAEHGGAAQLFLLFDHLKHFSVARVR